MTDNAMSDKDQAEYLAACMKSARSAVYKPKRSERVTNPIQWLEDWALKRWEETREAKKEHSFPDLGLPPTMTRNLMLADAAQKMIDRYRWEARERTTRSVHTADGLAIGLQLLADALADGEPDAEQQ